MDPHMPGKKAIITGANSRIGKEEKINHYAP